MLNFLPKPLIGVIAFLLLTINVLFWCTILFTFAIVKLALPLKPIRIAIDYIIHGIAAGWIAGNSGWMGLTQKTRWDVKGIDHLQYKGWYLVNSNHQSWVDIFVLQHLLNGKIPFLKFLLKHELIYVPMMGLAWWALDFPFMRRYSPEYLKAHPEMRGRDLAATRKACEKFSLIPTSVMNFPEGTRFTKAKHDRHNSPFKYLLKPKAGGIALALNTMGDKFRSLLNVTIVYPDEAPGFWDFLCGRVKRIVVRIQDLPIPKQFLGMDYENNPEAREAFQQWVNEIWQEKDTQIGNLLAEANHI
ncbi:MAG: putative acyltransferase YihG [Syntrophus sp. SKADARSKE-3]|nr:putative acyltransferase YihG [Syntrophus sp. SKADARSKE-3]